MAVYLLQKWLLFDKLQLWLYWLGVVVYRKFMAGAFCRPTHRLNGYTIIITGADSGIGKEVAKELTLLGKFKDKHCVLAQQHFMFNIFFSSQCDTRS